MKKTITTHISLIIILLNAVSPSFCKTNDYPQTAYTIEYRNEMRKFVISISQYGKKHNSLFSITPQNGQNLITDTGKPSGLLQIEYINSINATGREDLFYGYNNDDQPTPQFHTNEMLELCAIFRNNKISVLVTDYCVTQKKVDNSYYLNNQHGFISFAANKRNLTTIPGYPPEPYNMNNNSITNISQAKNFLYLINSEKFSTKNDFITAVNQTNYDLIIMDLYHEDDIFTPDEIQKIKTKSNGGERLIICYMSIGEAETYRYYWNPSWSKNKPDFIADENPAWKGNFKVRYWDQEWQHIITGNDESYLKKIVDAGFDGVYLDIIDAFEYFEN